MTDEEKDKFDREKFAFDKEKSKIEQTRFELKERRDNLRAALSQAHEDHRKALGAVYKTLIAYFLFPTTLIGAYAGAANSSDKMIKAHVLPILLLGLGSWFVGVYAQWISIKSFRFNFDFQLEPVRSELELRQTDEGAGKRTREWLEFYTLILLIVIYVVYLYVWVTLLGISFLSVINSILR